MSLTPQERDFLWTLEKIEARQVAMGDFDSFVELKIVCLEMGLELSQGLELARTLGRRRFLLLDRSTESDLVKSKVANVIKSLFYTTTLVQNRLVRDVSDLKYLRFIKQIPRLTISLDGKETRESLVDRLGSKPGPERDVVESGILAIASQYPKVSAFQLSATQEILELFSEKKDNQSLVIVAETGAGKTLAYQLPLLLWILNKKMREYLKKKSTSKTDVTVNCSALLVFPRNVLAKDQYDELVALGERLSDKLKKQLKLPTNLRSFLKIKVERDFGGVSLEERIRIYESSPDVIITNTDTLKRRLMNPLCTSLYQKGIDLVLYDEVHLYYGLFGANVASLNARLQNLLPWPPVFVGMSATIANPQKHCQKLFSVKNLPDIVTDREDMLRNFSLEHHVITKPRAGRPSLGVCIDTTSCLLHNRRENIMETHRLGNELRPKSLCFVDSLDLTGRWVSDQRNYENFQVFPAVRTRFRRGYPVHFAPWAARDPTQTTTCMDCKSGKDIVASLCREYQDGRCWWFSLDSASPVRWLTLPNGITPNDNIRVKRLTSQEVSLPKLEDIYSLFHDHELHIPVDALIATSVLEVGVDFREIKEVIMYGEIRSPSSYKQKAGRGAREGNLDEGLFVMTVIPPSPLANFYYRHFYRLVYPSLAPLPLEPRNPDIIRSHAFCAVFDFLALQGIDVFNVITANQHPEQVEQDFDRAISFIRTNTQNAKNFVVVYLRRLGETTTRAGRIAQNAIDRTLKALEYLSSEYEIEGEKRKLVIWIFEAFRDMGIMASLEDDFEANLEELAGDVRAIVDSRESIALATKKVFNAIFLLGDRYKAESSKIKKLLSILEGTL